MARPQRTSLLARCAGRASTSRRSAPGGSCSGCLPVGRLGGDDGGVQIMPIVIRRLTLLALAVATLLAAAACGGEESAVCGDLENIQSSIQGVGDIELEEGALEELQQTAADIDADLQAAQANADAELGDELDALRTAVQALVSEAETAAATGLSGESVQALSAAISDVRTSFQSTQAAAPDCDL
jgi:hypothetical protein